MTQNIPIFENNINKHPVLWFVSNIDGNIYNTEKKHCKVEKRQFQGKMEWFVDVLGPADAEGSFVEDEVIGYENLKELEQITGKK